MEEKQRTWLEALIAFAAVVFVILFSPSPAYKPKGVFLPSHEKQRSTPSTFVSELVQAPLDGIVLGRVNIERRYLGKESQAVKQIMQLAKALCVPVGANALVVDLLRTVPVTAGRFIYVFQATAYYSPAVHVMQRVS